MKILLFRYTARYHASYNTNTQNNKCMCNQDIVQCIIDNNIEVEFQCIRAFVYVIKTTSWNVVLQS